MFTLQQMKAAHAKVKSGTDFPVYIQEIKQLGLLHYDFLVKNGQTEFHGANGLRVHGEEIYPDKKISTHASPLTLQHIITEHQQNKTNFLTFCELVANVGVQKWTVDTQAMMCTYYDLQGNAMVAEPIPEN